MERRDSSKSTCIHDLSVYPGDSINNSSEKSPPAIPQAAVEWPLQSTLPILPAAEEMTNAAHPSMFGFQSVS